MVLEGFLKRSCREVLMVMEGFLKRSGGSHGMRRISEEMRKVQNETCQVLKNED